MAFAPRVAQRRLDVASFEETHDECPGAWPDARGLRAFEAGTPARRGPKETLAPVPNPVTMGRRGATQSHGKRGRRHGRLPCAPHLDPGRACARARLHASGGGTKRVEGAAGERDPSRVSEGPPARVLACSEGLVPGRRVVPGGPRARVAPAALACTRKQGT